MLTSNDWIFDVINVDIAKQLKLLSLNRDWLMQNNWYNYRLRIECVYRLFELNISQKLQQLSFLELNISRKLNIALQLNVVHINKTTIKIVNRYSIMLSFVKTNMFES